MVLLFSPYTDTIDNNEFESYRRQWELALSSSKDS